MKKALLALLAGCALAFAASAPAAADTAAAPTLRGVLMTGDGPLFSLASSDGSARWVELGKTFDDWKLASYDASTGTLTLSQGEHTRQISLASAKSAAASGKATLADATALMDQMRFTEMVRKTVEQQREAFAGIIRQMLAQQGVQGAEADKLAAQQSKLVNIMLDEMNIEDMKDDVAKAYADIFTKDEIQGMASFYNTPVGQSTLDKQPALQARMQTIMVPRMMKAIPKVQQAALEMTQGGTTTPAP